MSLHSLMESLNGQDATPNRGNYASGATELDDFSMLGSDATKGHTATIEVAVLPSVKKDVREDDDFEETKINEGVPTSVGAGIPKTFVEWNKGRPQIAVYLKKASANATEAGKLTGVFACGPASLMTDLKQVSGELDTGLLSFHYENFII
eukprot:GDKK01005143.1.p1 GENE.GDKK01005143.1~~GDKK01005143.1.p1  ORF type:complete len:150 (+),score=18.28 GDKK01005143.1:166-615(+)